MKPVALITGGQQGIGLGIAEALVEAGFAIALASYIKSDDVRCIPHLSTHHIRRV